MPYVHVPAAHGQPDAPGWRLYVADVVVWLEFNVAYTGYEGIVAKLKWNVSIRPTDGQGWKRRVPDMCTPLGGEEQL